MKRSTFLKKKKKLLKKGSRFETDTFRVTLLKTNKHFYASLVNNSNSDVVFSLSSATVGVCNQKSRNKISTLASAFVLKAKDFSKNKLVFDRSVYKYHGHVKHFAECIREEGLKV